MGGGGPQGPMTLEQKKKLLWGKKPDPEEPAPSTAFGANRWDTAEFSNAGDKNKFIKLMVMLSCYAIYPADVQTAADIRTFWCVSAFHLILLIGLCTRLYMGCR